MCKWLWPRVLAVVVACFLLPAFGEEDSSKTAGRSNADTNKRNTVIDEYAVPTSYLKSGWPSWYKKHGDARMLEALRLVKIAADRMAATGACKILEIVDLSDRSKVGEFVFYGDCASGFDRMYVTESELLDGAKIVSEQSKSWDKSLAVAECRDLILANVKYPSTADIHYILGISVRKVKLNGRVVVTQTFDAKNDFGAMLPYEARCRFLPGESAGTIEIFNR